MPALPISNSMATGKVTEVRRVTLLSAALLLAMGILVMCSIASAADEGPPRIKDVKFSPARPETGGLVKLRISLEGSASRADVKVFKNDEEVQSSLYDGISEYLELGNRFKAGDKLKVEVVPIDSGGTVGRSVTKEIEIANAPPTAKLVDQKLTGTSYTARIESTDPEGDPISFAVKQGPSGFAVDQKGNLKWNVGEATGTFPIEISIKDSHGAEVILSYSIGLRREQGRSGP